MGISTMEKQVPKTLFSAQESSNTQKAGLILEHGRRVVVNVREDTVNRQPFVRHLTIKRLLIISLEDLEHHVNEENRTKAGHALFVFRREKSGKHEAFWQVIVCGRPAVFSDAVRQCL